MVDVLVVGHICLDIFPGFIGKVAFEPGRLIEVGPATLSTGGAVSNTGQALHKLGVKTGLSGKIGADLFGEAVCEILEGTGKGLGEGMIVASAESTSYSIVISLSGEDRMFLHAPGANDTFEASDVPDSALAGAKLVHFGYPTLMAGMYADGGRETVELLRRAKALGATTSMDVSLPDLAGPAAQADWHGILERTLPYTDLFLPSVDELHFCVDQADFRARLGESLSVDEIRMLTQRVHDMGAKVVCVKAGDRGLYLSSEGDFGRIGRARPENSKDWENIEIWAPCFEVVVAGTTGAGDATIAGLLMAWLRGMPPAEAARAAAAVGACCCESHDAVSGVPPWDVIRRRIASGWRTASVSLGPGWAERHGVFVPG